MAIQYVDKVADVCCTLPEPYNITSSNNQFSISVDGGSNQVITLTNGSTRTAAQVVTDLGSLTGCTPSVVSFNGINYVRIRGTSSNGTSSTLAINAPSNNCNSILGLTPGGTTLTYNGGANVAYTFLADTAQHITNGVEQALNNAGWITVSGHQSTPCIVQSAMTPPNQNLRMQIKMVTGTNCQLSIQNVAGSLAGSNGSSPTGGQLSPQAGMAYTVIANKYQAWCLIAGSATYNTFCAFGVPYVPSFLQGVVWEAMWLNSNANNSNVGPSTYTIQSGTQSLRNGLHTLTNNSNVSSSKQAICNGNLTLNLQGNSGTIDPAGCIQLAVIGGAGVVSQGFTLSYRWHDGTVPMNDALIGWGTVTSNDECTCKGQLWDAFISSELFLIDQVITGIDSHNWHNITFPSFNNSGGGGNEGGMRGSLFIVTPETATA